MTPQQEALSTIQTLLTRLPINPPSDHYGQDITLSLGPDNTFGRIERTGMSEWYVDIGVANMQCTDPVCIENFLSSYQINSVSVGNSLYYSA